jgi:hypothetical protein
MKYNIIVSRTECRRFVLDYFLDRSDDKSKASEREEKRDRLRGNREGRGIKDSVS